jgi:thioredoxin reductase (NADPH)
MNKILLYGADWCLDCRRAKSFLKENSIDFTFIDVDLDKEATDKVEAINKGKRIIPTYYFPQGVYLKQYRYWR